MSSYMNFGTPERTEGADDNRSRAIPRTLGPRNPRQQERFLNLDQDPFELSQTSQFYSDPNDATSYGLAGHYMGQSAQAGQAQQEYMNMLRGIATGDARSAAENQMRQGLGMAMAQQQGAAKGMRGAHMGAVNAGLQQGLAQTQVQGMSEVAELRSREQQAAQSQLAQLAGQQQAQQDSMVRYFMQLGYSMDEANRAAEIERMRMAQDYNLRLQDIGLQREQAGLAMGGQALAAAGQIGAALAS